MGDSRSNNQTRAGFSLVELMISCAVAPILLYAVMRLVQNTFSMQRTSEQISHLPDLRATILEQTSCPVSLGVAPNASAPCVINQAVNLRRANGSPVIGANAASGLWRISASIKRNAFNECFVSVGITLLRDDPVLKQKLDFSFDTHKNGQQVGDLFANTGSLCRDWLNPRLGCPGGTTAMPPAGSNPPACLSNVAICPPDTVQLGFNRDGTINCQKRTGNRTMLSIGNVPPGQTAVGVQANGTLATLNAMLLQNASLDQYHVIKGFQNGLPVSVLARTEYWHDQVVPCGSGSFPQSCMENTWSGGDTCRGISSTLFYGSRWIQIQHAGSTHNHDATQLGIRCIHVNFSP